MKAFRPGRAFTLLEVLVSLAIFALAAVALSAAYVNTLQAARAANETTLDTGDWRMVRAVVLGEPRREVVERGGELSLADEKQIRWTVDVQSAGVLDLFEVRLRGEITPGTGVRRQHDEVFRVLRPTWSAPAERARLLEAAKRRPVEAGS